MAFQEFFKNWFKYFYGTIIFKSEILALLILSAILDLNLNDLESFMLLSRLSLQYCHKLADVSA